MKFSPAAARFIFCTTLLFSNIAIAGEQTHWPTLEPASRLANAETAPVLAAALAGDRAVAVGDHGVILLSDDGLHFRQAKSVPVRSMLTTVQFLDARRGFAAGHDGVVLGTQDGGETWSLLRAKAGLEQPIHSLYFDSPEHGVAVGLFGWAIETRDAGHSWTELHIGGDKDGDRHLFHVFKSAKGTWLIAAEAGAVFRSADGGKEWQTISTGNLGSFWHGLALSDGTLLLCGMRGHLYRSADDGQTWQPIETNTTQSLTSMEQLKDGSVVVVGMNGTVLRSVDAGATFSATTRPDAASLTEVIADGAKLLLFSMSGPIH